MFRKFLTTLAQGSRPVGQLLTSVPKLTKPNATMHYSAGLRRDSIFRQMLEYRSNTYTYLLGCRESKEAVLIDPVLETVDRDLAIANELGLKIKYCLNTHVHADHVSGSGEIKKKQPDVQNVLMDKKAKADIHVGHGDLLEFGRFKIECRHTPGHTAGCITYVWHEGGYIFTGDTLLIRGCGRSDFPQGDSKVLYQSCHKQILSLPDEYIIFPGHDYKGLQASSVGEERQHNTRLTKDLAEFVEIMANLKLPYPQQIEVALKANLVDGIINHP